MAAQHRPAEAPATAPSHGWNGLPSSRHCVNGAPAAAADAPRQADAAIARAEQLLKAVPGEPWAETKILPPLSLLYAYAGRFADARDSFARGRSMVADQGTKFLGAELGRGGQIELIAGSPVAAERYLRQDYEVLQAMGERGILSTIAGVLAEAVYRQGRFDEAQQLTEEAQALAAGDDLDAQARWGPPGPSCSPAAASSPPPADWPPKRWRWSHRPPGRCSRPKH